MLSSLHRNKLIGMKQTLRMMLILKINQLYLLHKYSQTGVKQIVLQKILLRINQNYRLYLMMLIL
jgi:hypothetical protein